MRILNTYSEAVPPDNPMTEEETVDLCCTDVPFDPCAKTGRVSDYSGAEKEDWNFDPDRELAKAQADNPKIISVSTEAVGGPRPGEPCGKKYETWKGKNNCCDFVEPIVWDGGTSADVVAPGERVMVGVLGGAPPYHVSVRGEGFTLDGYRIRDGWTDTPYFWIYAGPFACGSAYVEVSDGCSVAKGWVRSTVGNWSINQYFYDVADCVLSGIAEESGNTWGVRIFSETDGKWKQTITAEKYWFAGGGPCLPDIYDIPVCASLESYVTGPLASFCTGKVPSANQVWCWDNMYGGAVADDPNGCCDPITPQRPASVSCDRTIDAWVNEWRC